MKIGIMGCGSIANTLTNFQLNGKLNVKLSYFYDINRNNAINLAKKIDAEVVDTIEELIERSDLILEAAAQSAVRNSVPKILEMVLM